MTPRRRYHPSIVFPGEKPAPYPPRPAPDDPLAGWSREEAGRLPNLIGIGAGKAGTSALHAYLAAHPEVSMSRRKELMLFGSDGWSSRLRWYASHFDANAPIRGEASPTYSMDPFVPGVPEQMAVLLPDPRFIYLVRDPVDRALAHWREQRMLTLERRPVHEAFADADDPLNPYVGASRYAHQLERYLSVFPADRVLVVDQVDLRERRRETLRRVFAFAGIDSGFWDSSYQHEANTTKHRVQPNRLALRMLDLTGAPGWARRLSAVPLLMAGRHVVSEPLERQTRSHLESVLRSDAARFRELTGQPFAHWSV